MRQLITGYQIGQFRLDLNTRSLLTADAEVLELPERSLNFLIELARHYPDAVSKSHLHEVLWPDREVSDWALSRIVSDTRLVLQDDGKQQELIKTARGIGYSLRHCDPLTESQNPESLASSIHGRSGAKGILIRLILLLIVVLLSFKVYAYMEHRRLVVAMEAVTRHQDYTLSAFKAQSRRRDELVEMLKTRLHIDRRRQYEKFFSHYYDQLNQEELFVFSQMRAITESSLYPNNQAVYQLLVDNPEIFDEIPLSTALFKHLQFWLNKYRSVFLDRPDMALLYVGVEDGVPYPSAVDKQFRNWLKENN